MCNAVSMQAVFPIKWVQKIMHPLEPDALYLCIPQYYTCSQYTCLFKINGKFDDLEKHCNMSDMPSFYADVVRAC